MKTRKQPIAINPSGFPLLERLSVKELRKAIRRLSAWQAKHYPGHELEVITKTREAR